MSSAMTSINSFFSPCCCKTSFIRLIYWKHLDSTWIYLLDGIMDDTIRLNFVYFNAMADSGPHLITSTRSVYTFSVGCHFSHVFSLQFSTKMQCSMVFYTFDICVHRLLGTPLLWIEWIKFDKDNGTCATSIALFVFYQSILIQSFDAFYVSSLFCRRNSTRCYCLFSHLADDLIKMMNNLNCFGPVEMSHKVHSHSSILLSFQNQF